jgi:hypothetical protein
MSWSTTPRQRSKRSSLTEEIIQPIGGDAPEITARFRDPGGNVIGIYQEPSG